jgi:acyl-CoA thioester hydrolase
MSSDERALTSRDFPVHWPVLTRWTDNDMFGHLNNAVYYELFDTAINAWINTSTDVDPVTAPWLGVVAESGCRFYAELKFPDPLVVGLAVTRLGTSSVTYRLAVFEPSGGERSDGEMVGGERSDGEMVVTDAAPVAAVGHWVHVYVDRSTRRPVPVPAAIRSLLEPAVVA